MRAEPLFVATLIASALILGCARDATNRGEMPEVLAMEHTAAVEKIGYARQRRNGKWLIAQWGALKEYDDGRLADDSNQLQIAVLVAEEVQLIEPSLKPEIERFFQGLARSSRSQNREMVALALDSVNGPAAVEMLLALLVDNDKDVAEYAAQSINRKFREKNFSPPTPRDDLKTLERRLTQLCNAESFADPLDVCENLL